MSTLTVQNIQGSSSSGNTVNVTGGHTLDVTLVKGEGTATTNLKHGLAKVRAQYLGNTNTLQTGALNNSSVTDNGTGDFTHNFSNNFSDVKYSVHGSNQRSQDATITVHNYDVKDNTARATNQVNMESYYVYSSVNRTNFDFGHNDLLCLGDLA